MALDRDRRFDDPLRLQGLDPNWLRQRDVPAFEVPLSAEEASTVVEQLVDFAEFFRDPLFPDRIAKEKPRVPRSVIWIKESGYTYESTSSSQWPGVKEGISPPQGLLRALMTLNSSIVVPVSVVIDEQNLKDLERAFIFRSLGRGFTDSVPKAMLCA